MRQVLIKFFLTYRVEALEAYLVLFAIGLSFIFPRFASKWFAKREAALAGFARHRTLAVVTVGLLALAARLAVLPILPIPVPSIHDEFENLLMADTFSHFRLTNPPHPMRIHLETFHILQEPSYTGIVPPAQGMLLAAGRRIGGHPFVGVWLSVGMMCAAICWMLQAWLPPPWAFLGGCLAVIRFAVFSYWSDSYWGGALAAAAGAVVLGALPRIWKHRRIRDSVIMALGIAVLANTRPYEGFILSLPVATGLFAWMLGGKGPSWKISMYRVVLPMGLLLTITAGAMAYYNWRVTGSAFRTAYQVSMATVNPVPYFAWQNERPMPVFHYKVLEDYYLQTAMPQYQKVRSLSGLTKENLIRLNRIFTFYFGIALAFPLILAILMGGFRAVFGGRIRFLSLCLLVTLAGLFVEVQFSPHYAAPLTGIFVAIAVQAIRYVRVWGRQSRPIGLLAMRLVPIICVYSLLNGAGQISCGYYIATNWPNSWYSVHIGNINRSRMLAKLEEGPGRHLIIVRYAVSHSVHDEWVYNDSDIDGAKVVWARDMDPVRNQELVNYFQGRHIWLLEPDKLATKLLPYPGSEGPLSSNSANSHPTGMD